MPAAPLAPHQRSTAPDLITRRPEGLYCAAGDFYIDPWRPVDKAVVTHAHADHARTGSRHYLASARGENVLRSRLGNLSLQALPWGETVDLNGVRVSLHPAGHVLGSAQVRVEYRGEVWVASGDYRTGVDPTCDAFEPVPCHTFITESTFGLPVYRWRDQARIFADINGWWQANADAAIASVLYCYSFGKAQRILAGVDATIGSIVVHGAVQPLNAAYRATGIALPETHLVTAITDPRALRRALVLAPPSTAGTPWLKRFAPFSDAFASGWMQLRGARRRRAVDRGFVLSDHADWPGLQEAISATGATRVIVTHGYEAAMVRWLTEQGLQADAFETEYGQEDDAPNRQAQEGDAPQDRSNDGRSA